MLAFLRHLEFSKTFIGRIGETFEAVLEQSALLSLEHPKLLTPSKAFLGALPAGLAEYMHEICSQVFTLTQSKTADVYHRTLTLAFAHGTWFLDLTAS